MLNVRCCFWAIRTPAIYDTEYHIIQQCFQVWHTAAVDTAVCRYDPWSEFARINEEEWKKYGGGTAA